MRRISPSELAAFLAIARYGSFRRAADELSITPSAVSHALRALESRLNVRLLNRTTRSVALTDAGEQLQARIAPAFRDIDEAIDELDNFRAKPTGHLRIVAPRASAQIALLPLVKRFQNAYPGITIEIELDNTLVDIVSERFDLGVRLGETLTQNMIAIPLGPPLRSAFVASPEFFERFPQPTRPEDLEPLPCIRFRFRSGRYYAWEFEREGTKFAVDFDGPLALNDQALCIDAALDGAGIAFAFDAQVADLVAQGRLIRVLEDWCPFYPGFYLYYSNRRNLAASLRAFVDFARRNAPRGVGSDDTGDDVTE